MKKVTIISIFYNRANTVDQSVESLKKQTYQNLEILLIDDGSTDSTFEKLKAWEGPNIHVTTQKNQGFTKTLVGAIKNLDTDYLAIHGSGDISHPKRIETQVRHIEKEKCDLIATNRILRDETTGKIAACANTSGYRTIEHFARGPQFTHGSALFNYSSYLKIGGYNEDYTYCQDYELWLRMAKAGMKIYVINEVLYTQIAHLNGATYSGPKAEKQTYFTQKAKTLHLSDLPSLPQKRLLSHATRKGIALTLTGRYADAGNLFNNKAASGLLKILNLLDPNGKKILTAREAYIRLKYRKLLSRMSER